MKKDIDQKQEKKVFIVGSGPSSKCPELKNHIEGYEIARINWFFLEKEKIFGNSMNYVFCGSKCEAYLHYLYYYLNKKNIYNVANFYLRDPLKKNSILLKILEKKISSLFLPPIENSAYKCLNNLVQEDCKKLGIIGYSPTTGFHILYQLLKVGYRKIKICGFDFYQTKTAYSLIYNKMLAKNIMLFKRYIREVTKEGYIPATEYKDAKAAHSLQADLIALNKILDSFPDAQIEVFINDENVLKIWERFKNQVKITMLPSPLEKSVLYDPYLDKKWLQEASAEFRKKYGKKFHIERLKLVSKVNLSDLICFIIPKNIRYYIPQKIKKPIAKFLYSN